MNNSKPMNLGIGSFVKFSTQDYPDKVSIIVFLQGCPLRCTYCYNKDLQPFKADKHIVDWNSVICHLEERRNLLDAVVFSGGEPLANPWLLEIMIPKAKSLGYLIGLHTSGYFPNKLLDCLPSIDYVGLDVKGTIDKYDAITGVKGGFKNMERSLDILLASQIQFECRTTKGDELDEIDLLEIMEWLAVKGVRRYAIQSRRDILDDGSMSMNTFDNLRVIEAGRRMFEKFEMR